jgi:hypothetical protein
MNRVSLLVPMLVVVLGVSMNAKADETLKYRAILHGTSVQAQDVGDVDGHIVNLARFSGITEFPDGSTGTGYFIAVGDYTKGSGPAFSYNNLTLEDGSVLWFKVTQMTKLEGTKSLFRGIVDVLGGKGRFEGAKGGGTFTGVRTVPLAAGADLYFDYVINLKK